ncbi:YbaB/EbfC family nucleoid-associated protein [Parafrankia discariae]|uniref:YbaB/EbfC family nucleoid-associated protein n=1 Tax=Parafrankia discariae TaxID=365528 RepID=UPI000553BDDC|nr:YbaB/EbfC family nucleoid-associated protein [Parafrankia discariae]
MSNPQIPAGGGANLGQILEQAQRMQSALFTAQQELAEARVEGSAGGELVVATVNGGGELVDLVIKPEAVDPEDTETLADLVLAAVRDATTNAHRLAAEKMSAATGGLGGALGGLGGAVGGPGGGALGGGPGAASALGGLGLPGLG